MQRFGLVMAGGAVALLSCVSLAGPAGAADDVKFDALFRDHVLKCIHPTVDPSKATIEQTKGPEKSGDTTTARLKVYYPGLIKKDTLEVDVMVRQSGSIRQMKANVLADSATPKPCDYVSNWKDF